MNLRKIIIAIFILLLAAALGYGILLYLFFDSIFGESCDHAKTYHIEGYKIKSKQCIGWAGPPFYKRKIYKNWKLLDLTFVDTKDCNLIYAFENDSIVYFDLCEESLKYEYPKKNQIGDAPIDSIVVTNFTSKYTRTLPQDSIASFLNIWNHSEVSSAKVIGKRRRYKPLYIVKIYSNSGLKVLHTTDDEIQEQGSYWAYRVSYKTRNNITFDDFFMMGMQQDIRVNHALGSAIVVGRYPKDNAHDSYRFEFYHDSTKYTGSTDLPLASGIQTGDTVCVEYSYEFPKYSQLVLAEKCD